MGDVLSLSVLLDPLKARYTNAKIYLITQPKNEFVYQSDPRIVETIVHPFPWANDNAIVGNIKQLIVLICKLCKMRRMKWDMGIDTRGDLRSQFALVVMGCAIRVGPTQYLNSDLSLKGRLLNASAGYIEESHRFDFNIAVVNKALDIVIPDIHFPAYKPAGILAERFVQNKKQVVFHPGSGWLYRQWPHRRWIDLINRVSAELPVFSVLVGGSGEKEVVDNIENNLLGAYESRVTSFDELIAILKGSDLFVGLDSGPMNLSSVLGVSSVALFGPGDFEQWRPYLAGSVGIIHKFPCNPCLQKKCIYQGNNCMKAITVEEVYAAIKECVNE